MKNFKMFRTVVVLGLMLALVAGFGFAQSTKGTIAGVVSDASGAVVPNATVTASASAGGETRSVVTGSNGEYRIEPLTPGEYTVLVSAQGFAKTKVERVIVRTSVITSNNVQLSIASTGETVEVIALADAIQTESGELSKTISTTAIQDLPYSNLNPYSLATTLPGVTTTAGRDKMTNGTSFSVNGLRPRSNNFLVDGFDNNDNAIAGQAFQPQNTEAVQEVTVLTNSYAAEFGRGGGSVSNLSFRSGSNQLHGAAWENYKGAGLNALTSEDSTLGGLTRPVNFVENIFGFRLGGPIKKDKLYFFGTSQWDRYFGDSGAAWLKIPTAAGYDVLNRLAQAGNANAALMIQPLENFRAGERLGSLAIGDRPQIGCLNCTVDYGWFRRTDKGKNISREWMGRVDYTGANDSVYVRYTDSRNDTDPDLYTNPNALPSQDTLQGGPSRILGTFWSHTFNSHLINEFRFSGQQIDFSFDPLPSTAANPLSTTPTISLNSGLNFFWGGYSGGGYPQGRGHKNFQFQDAVMWNLGTHTMKLGADLAAMLVSDRIPFNTYGLLGVSRGGACSSTVDGVVTGHTCSELENYLDGFAGPSGTFSKNWGNPRQNVGTSQQAYYFQDSWKVKSNLTIDYGVRYEYQPFDALNSVPYPAIDRATFATDGLFTRKEVKNDRNNFAPRFGFAYTPTFWKSIFGDQKTVLRGGYGMFYDAFFTNMSNNVVSSLPNATSFSVTAADSALFASSPANAALNGRGYNNPLTRIASATAVANIRSAITWSTDTNFVNPLIHQWNLNVQRELPAQLKAEIAYVGTRGERLWLNEQLNPASPITHLRDVPTRGSIVIRSNRGDSNYHGLQTQLSRSIGWVQLRGSYTWSKAIDNQSEVFASSGGASRWQDVKNPRSDRGVSAYDRTHRASISYSIAPPAPWKSGVLSALFGGWATTGVLSFSSGVPETIYFGGFDQNGDGEGYNDRPTAGNPKGSELLGYTVDGTTFYNWTDDAEMPRDSFRYLYIDGQNGNIARNSFRYPGTMDFDASVTKDINMPYAEGHKVQLRMDLFNAFNHPNLGVAGFSGDVTDAVSFLNLEQTRRGGRSVALWLKYSF